MQVIYNNLEQKNEATSFGGLKHCSVNKSCEDEFSVSTGWWAQSNMIRSYEKWLFSFVSSWIVFS